MNYDIKIIKRDEFPEKLKNIKKAPKILYAIGNTNLLYEESFGIVGTRSPTEYGEKVCKEFSKEFALREITIVSGMAIGIDQIAHKTALEYNSKTICVLGCGFKAYLQLDENTEIISEVVEKGGLVLSEYEVAVEKSKENFPERNRIIAALSEGVLVVEAAFRSGSSITARYAREYGKSVFAVPGNIYNSMSVGTNNLIKKGAILSTTPNEIIQSYPQFKNIKRKTINRTQKSSYIKKVRKEWIEIIEILGKETKTLEELHLNTQKDVRILMKWLSEMEIEGIVEQEIGIGYRLKSR